MKTQATAIDTSLRDRKAALLAKLAEIEGATAGRDELVVEVSADELDMITMATDRDVVVQRINQSDRILRDVRAALAAFDRGEYGICGDCEEPISKRRLEVLPWAQLCVNCQAKREEQGDSDDVILSQAA